MRDLLIICGASGAGNSTASRVLEEKGYRVVENITPGVMQAYLDDLYEHEDAQQILSVSPYDCEAIVKTARADKRFKTELLLISCSKPELMTRFRVTSHVHPLETQGLSLEKAITTDVAKVKELRPIADQFIDTTGLATADFRRILKLLFDSADKHLKVLFTSFGYKIGVPRDAEIVFDTRTVPNPFWDPELKDLNGNDPKVIKYLEEKPQTRLLMKYIEDFLDFFLDECSQDQKSYLNVAIGCTGGQHRSVYFANQLAERYSKKYECLTLHRELEVKPNK